VSPVPLRDTGPLLDVITQKQAGGSGGAWRGKQKEVRVSGQKADGGPAAHTRMIYIRQGEG